MVPFYVTKTLLFCNKTMFKEAGLAGPPKSFDEILAFAEKMTSGETPGLLTLNFDWLYWPLFAMNGVDLLTPDLKKTDLQHAEGGRGASTSSPRRRRAARSTRSRGPAAGSSPTTPSPPAMSACCMPIRRPTSSIKGQGRWVNADTLGVAHMPGNWATPNSHGLGISKGSKNPDLAWDFVKYITDNAQAGEFAERRKLLTGNVAVDKAMLAKLAKDDPLVFQVLKTQLEHTDKMCGNWRLGNDSAMKDAFWPEFQSALLGRKDAKTALADAERRVSRELTRS